MKQRFRGINVDRLYSILLVLVGISVVALTQVVGIVLVLTMLTLPQLCAGLYSRRLSSMMVGSVIISIFCTTGGLAAAWVLLLVVLLANLRKPQAAVAA